MALPPTLETPPPQSRCVPWHGAEWSSLLRLFSKQRLPHAMLLEGQPGTGRNMLALAVARFLLCSERDDEGNCGHCKTCVLSASAAHPDFISVLPLEAGKAIGIDAIREVTRFAAGTPTLGQHKVILISPAESLTVAAFNAFLKCLEEPASDTFIVLVTASGYPLPATIRSRCQRWQLPSPTLTIARDWLMASLGESDVSPDSAEEMLGLCNTRPLEALDKLHGEERDALIGLHRSAREMLRQEQKSLAFEQAVANVEPGSALDVIESVLQSWLVGLPAGKLRSNAARRGFMALDDINRLRAARRSGSNPNVDLLRFSAVSALNGLWER
ncbi:DNA polymerase III subunit delta' [Congregibacter sp.]|uniref:DNA polymerase III subunit delta' n=1 Tax=Congregibacter sp. TaxID=2744308 RepID=UPI003F6C3B18